ncbi:MAG TPA: DUF1697 domain-containing protein [Acidimicrobiia bacterium]|nr:DUF1697 domain-containing protein [Acidimicrobiia bacterium]
MTTYVALLRAVNVGGRKVPMQALRELFAGLGHRDVETYIQSGNVVFAAKGAAARVKPELEHAIGREFGFDVTVLLRTHAELTKVVAGNPFTKQEPYVTFLDAAPRAQQVEALDPGQFAPDVFAVNGREVYLHCPGGYGRTKINNAFFESRLAVAATTRNWNTVLKLTEMVAG